ncbi:hypothetical protein BGW41_007690 [Actinomortierella wolfii]|nr:hypothetical protein BGW41_007690 [Actinomortierella wolfii]
MPGTERVGPRVDPTTKKAGQKHRKVGSTVSQYTATNPFLALVEDNDKQRQPYQGIDNSNNNNGFRLQPSYLPENDAVTKTTAPYYYDSLPVSSGNGHHTNPFLEQRVPEEPPAPQMYTHPTTTALTSPPSYPMSPTREYEKDLESRTWATPSQKNNEDGENASPNPLNTTPGGPPPGSARGHKKRNSFAAWSIRRRRSTTMSAVINQQQHQSSPQKKPPWTREEFRAAIEQKNQQQYQPKRRPQSLFVTTTTARALASAMADVGNRQQDDIAHHYHNRFSQHYDYDQLHPHASEWSNPFLPPQPRAAPGSSNSHNSLADGEQPAVLPVPEAATSTLSGSGSHSCGGMATTNPFLRTSSSCVFPGPTSYSEQEETIEGNEVVADADIHPPRPSRSLSRSFTDTALLHGRLSEESSSELPAETEDTTSTSSSPKSHTNPHIHQHQRRASYSLVNSFRKTLSRTKTLAKRRYSTVAARTPSVTAPPAVDRLFAEHDKAILVTDEGEIKYGNTTAESVSTTSATTAAAESISPSSLSTAQRHRRVHEEQERLIELICLQREQYHHRHHHPTSHSTFSNAAANPWSYAHEFSEPYRRGESLYDQYGYIRGMDRDARRRRRSRHTEFDVRGGNGSSDQETVDQRHQRSTTEPASVATTRFTWEEEWHQGDHPLSPKSPHAHPSELSSSETDRIHASSGHDSQGSLISPKAFRVRGTNPWIACGPRGKTGSEIGAGYRYHAWAAEGAAINPDVDAQHQPYDKMSHHPAADVGNCTTSPGATAHASTAKVDENTGEKNIESSSSLTTTDEDRQLRRSSSMFWKDINQRAYGEEQLDELDELLATMGDQGVGYGRDSNNNNNTSNELPYDPHIFAGETWPHALPVTTTAPMTAGIVNFSQCSEGYGDIHTAISSMEGLPPAVTSSEMIGHSDTGISTSSTGSTSDVHQSDSSDWMARFSGRRRPSYSALSRSVSRRSRKLWNHFSTSRSSPVAPMAEYEEEEDEEEKEEEESEEEERRNLGESEGIGGGGDDDATADSEIHRPPYAQTLPPRRHSVGHTGRHASAAASAAAAMFKSLSSRIRPSPLRHQRFGGEDEDDLNGQSHIEAKGSHKTRKKEKKNNNISVSPDDQYHCFYDGDDDGGGNDDDEYNRIEFGRRLGRAYGSYNQLHSGYNSNNSHSDSSRASSRWNLNVMEEKARIQLAKVWHKVGHMVSPRSKYTSTFKPPSAQDMRVDDPFYDNVMDGEPWKNFWTPSTSCSSLNRPHIHPDQLGHPYGPWASSSSSVSTKMSDSSSKTNGMGSRSGSGLYRTNTRGGGRSTTLQSSVKSAVSSLKRQASRRFSSKTERSSNLAVDTTTANAVSSHDHNELGALPTPSTNPPSSSPSYHSFRTWQSPSWMKHNNSSGVSINSDHTLSCNETGTKAEKQAENHHSNNNDADDYQGEGFLFERLKKSKTGGRRVLKSMKRQLSIVVGHHSALNAKKEATLSPRSIFSFPSPTRSSAPQFPRRDSATSSPLAREAGEKMHIQRQKKTQHQQQQGGIGYHHHLGEMEDTDDPQQQDYHHRGAQAQVQMQMPYQQQVNHYVPPPPSTLRLQHSNEQRNNTEVEVFPDQHHAQYFQDDSRVARVDSTENQQVNIFPHGSSDSTFADEPSPASTSKVRRRPSPSAGLRRQSLRAGNRLMDPSCSIVLEHSV